MYFLLLLFQIITHFHFHQSSPTKVFISHYSNDVDNSLPFKKLCNMCSENEEFANQFLDHNNIDLAVYAEMLNLTATITTSAKKLFKETCSTLKLSDLLTIPEEAFSLLVLENCFKQWKWIAETKLNAHHAANTSSYSVSSTSCVQKGEDGNEVDNECSLTTPLQERQPIVPIHTPLSQSSTGCSSVGCYSYDDLPIDDDDDDNYAQIGPGYKYQYTQVRRDNKLGAGPWTREGMERYNAIVKKVISERKVRAMFEEHLMSYFKEKERRHPLLLKRKYKNKRGDNDDDDEGSPKKVTVIDLFTNADD